MPLDLYPAARALQRAGRWDDALGLLAADGPGTSDTSAVIAAIALRAEIVVDRHLWRIDPVADAIAAVAALAEHRPAQAAFLTGQLEYCRRLFKLGGTELHEDPLEAFGEAGADGALYGWAMFWRGVTAENLLDEQDRAASSYLRAVARAREEGDRLLESYVVRHQGFELLKTDRDRGVALLRRSLQLRAAVGARPATAAAQTVLAEVLGDTPEAAELAEIAEATAVELDLTWLKPGWS